MAYFGSSQEEEDLEEDDEEEEEEVRNGGGIHSHSGGSNSQASASSSCHSTPRKGKLPARQPLNGHGKDGTKAWSSTELTTVSESLMGSAVMKRSSVMKEELTEKNQREEVQGVGDESEGRARRDRCSEGKRWMKREVKGKWRRRGVKDDAPAE